ncbi:MAG: YkgJ family cysteine cluster protein [Desulfobacterales bacterium]|nr:YkgJ family cysteine cluster protein [Desulfobacterales bacterium]
MNDIKLITNKHFRFSFNPSACKECKGKCCNGESGTIWVNNKEMENIAKFLNIPIHELISIYLIKINNRFSIKEAKTSKKNYACIFFNNKSNFCSIYPVRPEQCITFPFWDYFKDKIEKILEECPGIITN